MHAIEAAYAIRSEPTPGTLDSSYDLADTQFQSLFPTLVLQKPVGTNLGEALDHLLDQALSHQFPRHPKFLQEVKPGKDLRQVLEIASEAARTPDGRVFVEDKNLRIKIRNICNPLELGQMSETHFVLDNTWKNHFNRMLAQSGQQNPLASEMRRWTDSPDERGLPKEIQNLLIMVYADQTNRSFRHSRLGGNYTPTLDDLPDELELQEQTLPDLKDWNDAVSRVAEVMGHAISKLMNASNLAMFAEKVQQDVQGSKADCDSLTDRLQKVLTDLGVPDTEFLKCDRVRTARSVAELLKACEGKEPTPLVGTIAQARFETNGTAMGKSLKSAKSVLDCLRTTRWDLFSAVSQLQDDRKSEAQRLIQDVVTWLKTDEHALVGGLASKLSDGEGRAIKLLTPPKLPVVPPVVPPPVDPPPVLPPVDPPKPKPGWKPVGTSSKSRLGHEASVSEANELLQKLKQNEKLRLTIQWTLEEESP